MAVTRAGHPGAGPSPYDVQFTLASPPRAPQIGWPFAVAFAHLAKQVPASLLGHVSPAPLPTAGPDVSSAELSGFLSPASLSTALLIQD